MPPHVFTSPGPTSWRTYVRRLAGEWICKVSQTNACTFDCERCGKRIRDFHLPRHGVLCIKRLSTTEFYQDPLMENTFSYDETVHLFPDNNTFFLYTSRSILIRVHGLECKRGNAMHWLCNSIARLSHSTGFIHPCPWGNFLEYTLLLLSKATTSSLFIETLSGYSKS